MTRETSMPAQRLELFTYDEKKNVYKPLTEGGAIPVVVKGGSIGGGNGSASTGEVTIKNDKLVVQLADKSLETKVTNDSLNVNVLNPVKTVESKVTNASLDVKVLNPVTETTIKNKTLDVKVAKSERKVVGLFGGKMEMVSHEPTDDGIASDFIEVSSYNQLALTSIITGKGMGGEEMTPQDIQQFNGRLEASIEWSHDGVNTHGVTASMAMTPDDVTIRANGKYIDILSKYVKVKVKSSHGGEWKPVMEMSLILK